MSPENIFISHEKSGHVLQKEDLGSPS